MPHIHLKTYDGIHYVCAENGGGGEINATRRWAAQWETFRMIPAQGGAITSDSAVNFSTYDGTHYVCAENGGGGEVNATRTAAAQWETFQIHRVDTPGDIINGSHVTLRTYNGHYLCAENGGGGQLNGTRTAAAQWETFTVEIIPVTFPIHVDGSKQVGDGQYVGATATLSDSGRIDCEVHVWTTNRMSGFHGAAAAFLVDDSNNILWNTQLQTLGVDGTWIPGLPSSRTEDWNETAPADVMKKSPAAVRLALTTNPTNMLMRDINMLVDAGKKLAELAPLVKAII